MVMSKEHFDRLMSKEEQEERIQRLKDAKPGEVLFNLATGVRQEWTDAVETLLHMAGVTYGGRCQLHGALHQAVNTKVRSPTYNKGGIWLLLFIINKIKNMSET